MGDMRLIRPMKIPGLQPNEDCGELPKIEWRLPSTLFVDEAYQRSLSKRSIQLIKKIVKEWNWNKFKPPVCVEHPNGYEVIDGQHTTIAACTHPHISKIPVVVVNANEIEDRASAFVSHNVNRIPVTATQIFFSKITAGDEEASQVHKVCSEEGINILRNPTVNPKEGDTAAIAALTSIYNQAGPAALRRVCKIVSYGKFKPVQSLQIRAIRGLLLSEEYKRLQELGSTDEDVMTIVRSTGEKIVTISKSMSANSKKKHWECAMAFYGAQLVDKINGLQS